MIKIKETQNYINVECEDCDYFTASEIKDVLDDLQIDDFDHIRSCVITVSYSQYCGSNGFSRNKKDFRLNKENQNWNDLLMEAVTYMNSKTDGDTEIYGHLLFKKPDPMKAIVDNVNLNLETLHGKLKKDL